jgi:hypothetical protein
MMSPHLHPKEADLNFLSPEGSENFDSDIHREQFFGQFSDLLIDQDTFFTMP